MEILDKTGSQDSGGKKGCQVWQVEADNLNSQNGVHVMSVQPWFPHWRATLRANEDAVTSPPRKQE